MRILERILNAVGLGGGDADPPKKFWQFIKNKSAEGEESSADLLLYGEISDSTWWGDEVTPKQFAADLAELGDVSTIRVRINSPGGDVFAAQAMYNLLKSHKAKIVTHIDGLAASSATVVAMAGDEIIMPGNSMMMVHNPWTYVSGDARDMRKMADTLDTVRDTILATYQAKTGMERSQLINLMNSETWLTADQAKEYGFADTVIEPVKVAASLKPGIFSVNGQEMDFKSFHVWPGTLLASAEKEAGNTESNEGEPGGTAPADGTENNQPAAGATDPEAGAATGSEPENDTEKALAADRKRIQDIDELAAGIPGAEKLAFQAKYEKPVSAEQFAVELVKSGNVKNATLLDARRNAANAADVPGSVANLGSTQADRETDAKAIADAIMKRRGGK
ncbi:MAG: head maturation protease, ClpP-related [Armatimonadota bacterium]